MPVEIERKFLVRNANWKKSINESYELAQGYLSSVPERTVRVRTQKKRGLLTIKGRGAGIVRPEFEYSIPLAEAAQLLLLCESEPIRKVRHEVLFGGKIWEIDVFSGVNEGLVLAEVELVSADESIQIPDWAGEEVSHDHRYFNAQLSRFPFSGWPDNKRF